MTPIPARRPAEMAFWTGRNRASITPRLPLHAQVAQLVEHATENRSVGGSIPPLGTTSCSRWFVDVRRRPHLQNISVNYVQTQACTFARFRWQPLAPHSCFVRGASRGRHAQR